jgi:ATP-dependent RNA helicase DHX8/PRP22
VGETKILHRLAQVRGAPFETSRSFRVVQSARAQGPPFIAPMDDLEKLQYLSLVSKICTEFENHLGLTDKVLAEFVIDLADKHSSASSFNKTLLENGAEFPESFVANLYNIIQKMRPHKAKQNKTDASEVENPLVKDFPGLAMPNGKPDWMKQEAEDLAKYVAKYSIIAP